MRLILNAFIIFILTGCSVSKNINKKYSVQATPGVIAHRGAWKKNNLPENSISALRQAIMLKCYGSEFDIRMTADDTLVINHDPEFHKLSVENSLYRELLMFKLSNGEKLPTLREYILAGMKDNKTTQLVCEIKPSTISKERGKSIAGKVVQLIKDLHAENKVIYISFDYDILKKIRELDPKANIQYLEGNIPPDKLKADEINGADYHFSVFKIQPEWIDLARQNNINLNAWTVNNSEDMDWLLANNFDFITTNEPELLMERIQVSSVTAGWRLVWSDEFNYIGLPDSSKWNYDTGGHGWGNNEKQFYVEKNLDNAFVSDGQLKIVAQKKDHEDLHYTSSKLTTYQRFLLRYGKIEVRAQLPKGKGTWPAIWMLPETIKTKKEHWPLCGEIDIMEHVGKDPDRVHVSLHSELYNHMKGTQVTHFDTIPNVADVFHKYGIEWTEGYIRFFIDGKLFFESAKGQDGRLTSNEGWPFDKPYFLILNLAIGGNWGGEIDENIFPSAFIIDYVRIFKK